MRTLPLKGLGWNFRMSNLQAAVGLAQLERIDNHVEKKRQIGMRYRQNLSSAASIQLAVHEAPYATNIYWVNGVVITGQAVPAKIIMNDLADRGVGTRPFFFPLHKQPVLRSLFSQVGTFPNSEVLAEFGFYLPSGLTLTEGQIDFCSGQLLDVLNQRI